MRKWLPLLAISLGSVMLMVDVTIVNVALPDMARDLSTTFSSLQWVIDAYALVLAVLLIGIGAVSDARGHRRTFLVGLALFTVASVACGLAPTVGVLIGARAVQGVGGAAMFATTFALINGSYTGRDRGTAYGVFSAVSGAAAALGPIFGGLLTQGVSWRWIFLVNVPVCVVTILLTLAAVPAVRRHSGRRIDLAGTVTFAVTAAALTFAFIRSSDDGWTSPLVLGLLALTVVGIVAFVVTQARVRQPLVELALFREPRFAGPVLASLVLTFSAYGLLSVTTIWTQSLLGLTPIEAGLVALPLPAMVMVVSVVSGRVMHRVPTPLAVGGGIVLIGLGSLLTALLITPDASWTALIPGLALSGLGIGGAFPILSRTATAAVGDARSGMASGAINTARQLGQAFGIALLGSLAVSGAASVLSAADVPGSAANAGALVGGEAPSVLTAVAAEQRPHVDQVFHMAFASGLDVGFTVAGSVAVVVGLVVAWMLRGHPHGIESAPVETTPSRAVVAGSRS